MARIRGSLRGKGQHLTWRRFGRPRRLHRPQLAGLSIRRRTIARPAFSRPALTVVVYILIVLSLGACGGQQAASTPVSSARSSGTGSTPTTSLPPATPSRTAVATQDTRETAVASSGEATGVAATPDINEPLPTSASVPTQLA
ncbi:MAG: hypothetical protein M3281_05435, partial [Chloroflexota bacterium]|nr:hypothetical protein [Chloroflexota bacterium]